ncbi:phosphatase PAP2 family protein [Chloroflexota bacterium]
MESLLQLGIDLIIAIQQIQGPALNNIFRAITFLGEADFYLLLLPLIFWCVDSGLGARLAILVLFSSYLNVDLKDLFQQPRPFDTNPSVQLSDVEGYGLPSGHTQTSTVFWASIAIRAHKMWFSVVAIVLVVMIGFSRIYLGVHFPTDVLAGWLIGGALLGLYLVLAPRISRKLAQLRLRFQVLLALAVPLALLLIHPVDHTSYLMGTLAGIALGLALAHRYISWGIHGPWWHRALRFLIGSAVLFTLNIVLKVVVPSEDGTAFHLILRFLGSGIIGMWVSLGAPWLFRILQLVPKSEKNEG